MRRKIIFFCQVAMAQDGDPIRDIIFRPGTLQVRVHHPRRVGRPKIIWAQVEARRHYGTSL